MKTIRDLLEVAVQKARKVYKWVSEFVRNPENRKHIFSALWLVTVVSLLVITGIAVYGSLWITSSYNAGIIISTFLWAVFVGSVVLFFLPSKIVITLFGSLLGIGASEVATGASLLSKADQVIKEITKSLGLIVGADPIIYPAIWVFVIIVFLISIPAFFRDTVNKRS